MVKIILNSKTNFNDLSSENRKYIKATTKYLEDISVTVYKEEEETFNIKMNNRFVKKNQFNETILKDDYFVFYSTEQDLKNIKVGKCYIMYKNIEGEYDFIELEDNLQIFKL